MPETLEATFQEKWFKNSKLIKTYVLNRESDLQALLLSEILSHPLQYDLEFVRINLDQELYGWARFTEYPKLEWLAAVITSYCVFHFVDVDTYLLFLRAINYHGLFELYDIIKLDESQKLQLEGSFNYNKAVAKHFKDQGDMIISLRYYRKATYLSVNKNDDNLTAYSLILVAKLYSDYWQRKGLYKAFNSIVYERIKLLKASTNLRWHQICLDSYGKEIFNEDPKLGAKIFKKLLKEQYNSSDTFTRIKFRYLEAQINYYISSGDLRRVVNPIKQYRVLLQQCENNPKVVYIRNIQLLKIFRKIQETSKGYTKSRYLNSQIQTLKAGEAMRVFEECIHFAKQFRDRKFVASGYYEFTQWIENGDLDQMIGRKIHFLNQGYEYFKDVDASSIVTETYIKILQGLAKLYVEKKDWENALFYYDKLYNNLQKLTQSLENDSKVISSFLTEKTFSLSSSFPEFACLNKDELYKINDSIIKDYEKLARKLTSHAESMASIHKLCLHSFLELVHNFDRIITHDINYNMVILEDNFPKITKLLDNNKNSRLVNETINALTRAKNQLRLFQNRVVDEIVTSNRRLDIAKEIAGYISFISQNTSNNVKIDFDEALKASPVQFSPYLLTIILDNLINNAHHVGLRRKITAIIIHFSLMMDENLIYLIVEDNCGDINGLKAAVRKLNENGIVPSKKNYSAKGEGLGAIKTILDKNLGVSVNWEIIVPGLKNRKSLKIPLAKLLNSNE